jgi:hypothetical protein
MKKRAPIIQAGQEFRAEGVRNVTVGLYAIGPRRHSGHRGRGLDAVLAPAINERHFGRV